MGMDNEGYYTTVFERLTPQQLEGLRLGKR